MMKKTRWELERDYSTLRNSWNNIVEANTRLVDKNKWLEQENKRLNDSILLMKSMFNDPENKFNEFCYCKVIKEMVERCLRW